MKQTRITIRLDRQMSEALKGLCELTGSKQSTIIRSLCLQSLTIKSNNVNDIQEFVNKNKKEKEILLRIDSGLKSGVSRLAEASNISVAEFIRRTLFAAIAAAQKVESFKESTYKKKNLLKPVNDNIVSSIAKYQSVIKANILQEMPFDEDIYQDTIVLASTDDEALKVKSKGQLIAYFKKRYNMLLYRSKMQKKERKEVEYADYKKNTEEAEE